MVLRYKNAYHLRVLFLLLLFLHCLCSYGQLKQEQRYFRFQYHKYKWRTFHTDAFSVYFPSGYDSLCATLCREYPAALKLIKQRMTGALPDKPNIILYPSIEQLYESNIGLFEPPQSSVPVFIYKGNRLVLYFNGNTEVLVNQLYESLARSIWEHKIRDDANEQAKGPVQEKAIPLWYKEGSIRYFAHEWPLAAEDALKQSFKNAGFRNWGQVISYQPRLAGHAFCYFLSKQYYPEAVLQVFQQLKKKSLERALRLTTKMPMDSVFLQCFQFYNDRFKTAQTDTVAVAPNEQLNIPRKKGSIRNVLISPDGQYISYLATRRNKRTSYIYDLQAKRIRKVSRYILPPWIGDNSNNPYPLIQWDEEELLVTNPAKGKVTVHGYSPTGKKLDNDPLPVDGIKSISLLSSNNFLLSAYKKGQSDIVAYNVYDEKFQPYTNDAFDDGPLTKNSNDVYFDSNRTVEKSDDTTRMLQGIFSLKDKAVIPLIADTIPYRKWNKPQTITGNGLLATHTNHGTEKFAVIATNGTYKTLADYQPYQYFTETDQIAFHKTDKDSIRIEKYPFERWMSTNTSNDTTSPWLRDYLAAESARANLDSMLRSVRDNNPSVLDGILVPKNAKATADRKEDSLEKSLQYNAKKVKPYVLQLHSAYFTGKLNNDYFINRYQPYQTYLGQFKFPELSGMAQGGFTDLFENNHINIAFRLPASAEGSDFYTRYENTAKKLDWGLVYSRKVEKLKPEQGRKWIDENGNQYPPLAKVKTHYGEVFLTYPITYEIAAGFQQAIRSDRTIFLSVNRYSLRFEDLKSLWSISTLSFSVNKLQPTVTFLNKGIKGKALLDVFKAFSQQEHTVLGSTVSVQYHQPIYKYITLVTQGQAGYSSGRSKVLYNVAGIDNNIVPKIDTSVHFSQTAPYAFQSLVTPLRGYYQNTLYGNQFAVFNADVYTPLFQTLIPIETPLQFINLLQPGLFTDIASTKETWNPAYINKGWLWSYGASVRSNLAGYTLRFDIAWPGDFNKKPVWYLSLKM